MIKLRSNKGVTLVSEVITIIIMIIILSIISYSSISSLATRELSNMYNDITLLQEKAINYYFKNREAPIDGSVQLNNSEVITKLGNQLNVNDDGGEYYKIDLSKLSGITLNIKQTNDGYYFINNKTLTVYHNIGVEINNERRYTLPSNYEGIEIIDIAKYQN